MPIMLRCKLFYFIFGACFLINSSTVVAQDDLLDMLGEEEQKKVTDQTAAIKIMMEHNSIIKRPVIEIGEKLITGFNETEITKHLK